MLILLMDLATLLITGKGDGNTLLVTSYSPARVNTGSPPPEVKVQTFD